MATMRVIPPFPASNSPKKETAWRSSFLPFVCRVPLAGTFWLENRARARERKAPRPRNVGVLRWSLEVHGQRQIERVEQHRVFASKLEAERAKRRATIEVVSELLEARMEDGVSELPSPAQREPRLSIVTRSSADSKEMISARASFSVPSHLEFAVNKVLNFDRYTKLATRMFKVAKAGISLLDNRRSWLRSRISMSSPSLPEAEQDLTQFVNSMMESSPDVMVVQDTLKDSRCSSHPCVIGEPRIRFYAAVALIVNETKIGFLCLLDQKPGKKFGLREISMLLDLAGLISNIILQKQENVLSTENDIARINISVLYNLRHPLQSALTKFQELSAAHDDWKVALAATEDHERTDKIAQNFVAAVGEFSRSVSLVEDILEVCLNLATKYLEGTTYGLSSQPIYSLENKSFINPEPCDLCSYIISLQKLITRDIALGCKVNWRSEELRPMVLSTYPDIIKLTIMTTLAHISTHWKEVTVSISFIDPETYHQTLYGTSQVSKDARRSHSFGQPNLPSIAVSRSGTQTTAPSPRVLTSSASSSMLTRGRNSAIGYIVISFQCAHRKGAPRRSLRSSAPSDRHPLSNCAHSAAHEHAYSPAFDDVVIKNILGMVDGQVRIKSAAISFLQQQQQQQQQQQNAEGEFSAAHPPSPTRVSSHDSNHDGSNSPEELLLAAKYVAKWCPNVCVKERYDCYIPCMSIMRGSAPSSNVHTRVNSLVDSDGSHQRMIHSNFAAMAAKTLQAMPSPDALKPCVVLKASLEHREQQDVFHTDSEAGEDDESVKEYTAAHGGQERGLSEKNLRLLAVDENAHFKRLAYMEQELQSVDTSAITERPDRSFTYQDDQPDRPRSAPGEDEHINASQRIKRPAGPVQSVYQSAVNAVKNIFDGGSSAKIIPH